ncbi:hypothetical protein Plhal703r1_c30g0119321 [Plasmopara halstedii]
MIFIPLHCCILPLVWGLTLLTTAGTITAENSAFNAVAVVPYQHMKTHTPSKPDGDRELFEERVFPTSTMTELVGHELQPFADIFVSKNVIDQLHKLKYASENMQQLDHVNDNDAIYGILSEIKDKTRLLRYAKLLVWLGTKSPMDQKAAISTLLNILTTPVHTEILPKIFTNGKKKKGLFYVLAIAVERKWWLSISTSEMYEALGFSSGIKDDEDFVKQLGPLIWEKFDHFGEEDFSDGNTFKPFDALFNDLIRTAGAYAPIDAVKFLTRPDFWSEYNRAATADKSVAMLIEDDLLKLSQDELMWAKLMYMLRDDDIAINFFPGVFDRLLQKQIAVTNEPQHLPSQVVRYLTSQQFRSDYDPLVSMSSFKEMLSTLSTDKAMLAKVLYVLRNDKSLSEFPDILETFTDDWNNIGAHTKQISLRECEEFLKSENFFAFSLYKRFISNNPDASSPEFMRTRSTDEVAWALALYNLLGDPKYSDIFVGVLDALFHSWVAKPYNSVAATGKNRFLIGAYKLLRESKSDIDSRQPELSEAKIILDTLLEHSKDELMWARFLYKLKQDTTVNVVVSKVFDILLQTRMSVHTPSQCIAFLTCPSFPSMVDLDLLNIWSEDEVMWSKLLYMLGCSENEQPNSLHNLLLKNCNTGGGWKGETVC